MALVLAIGAGPDGTESKLLRAGLIKLPAAKTTGSLSVEQTMLKRRSVRNFTSDPIDLAELSQLLWAAQGVSGKRRYRTAPSAGALYPLEVFVVVGNVTGIAPGSYRYIPKGHYLLKVLPNDRRDDLTDAALRQEWIAQAPAVVVIAGVYERTAVKYGRRAQQYVHIEAGCACQNIYLQATARNLASTCVGAFTDERVQKVIGMNANERPLVVMPVGHPKQGQSGDVK